MIIKVYVDVLFIINFIIDYILLCITSLFIKRKACLLRLVSSAAVGALYAVFSFFAQLNPFISAVLSVFLALIMILICYGTKSFVSLLKNVSVFYLVSLCSAGLCFSTLYIGRNKSFLIGFGFLYADINAYTLLFVFIASIFIIHLSSGFIKKQRQKSRFLYKITIEKGEKGVTGTALFDTGNFLRDPLSQKSVVIAEWELVSHLFDKNTLSECVASNPRDFVYIPCRILGGNTSLFAFMPDKILSEGKILSNPCLVGISEIPLDKDETFSIILPNDFYPTERM